MASGRSTRATAHEPARKTNSTSPPGRITRPTACSATSAPGEGSKHDLPARLVLELPKTPAGARAKAHRANGRASRDALPPVGLESQPTVDCDTAGEAPDIGLVRPGRRFMTNRPAPARLAR